MHRDGRELVTNLQWRELTAGKNNLFFFISNSFLFALNKRNEDSINCSRYKARKIKHTGGDLKGRAETTQGRLPNDWKTFHPRLSNKSAENKQVEGGRGERA